MSKKVKLAKSDDTSTSLGKFTKNLKKTFSAAGALKPELEKLLKAQDEANMLDEDAWPKSEKKYAIQAHEEGLKKIEEYLINNPDATKEDVRDLIIKHNQSLKGQKFKDKGLAKAKINLNHAMTVFNIVKDRKKKEEMGEATGASSAGAYVGPLGYAKNEKNWRGASKTQWPGGKFVKVKEKCRHFPYCNQGDINALELWDSVLEKKIVKETIEKVSKSTGTPKDRIMELIKKELDEVIRRSFYQSPITSLVGNFKMNKPIVKISTMTPKGTSNKYE